MVTLDNNKDRTTGGPSSQDWAHVGTSPWALFSEAMARLGPFEQEPHLAVGVSGGADSVALALLADMWARERGGRITALTVDHRLRRGSDKEAVTVGEQLSKLGIEHQTLAWEGKKPQTAIQEAARHARYDLLGTWCREHAVLHLLLAHHQGDQAETCLMRAQRGRREGPGRAGMSAVVERPEVRLLRPLLQCPKTALEDFLRDMGQAWVEDPSNQDQAFERVRIRALLRLSPGLDRRVLADATRLAERRLALEDGVSALLARAVSMDPLGFAVFDAGLDQWPDDEVVCEALGRLLMTVGGLAYAPPYQRLLRGSAMLMHAGNGARFSLGGCRVGPHGGRLLVCREARNLPTPEGLKPGRRVTWDGRFQIRMTKGLRPQAYLTALGDDGWRQLAAQVPGIGAFVPPPVRRTLPAIFQETRLVAVPGLDWVSAQAPQLQGKPWDFRFRPANSLSGVGFFVA